ncbi:MAG: LPS-assembly protein LptD [Rhodoferax sp.]
MPGLRGTAQLQERPSDAQLQQAPVFLEGERLQGSPDGRTVIEGGAVLRKAGTTIRADRLEYDQPSDTARASGAVRVNRMGNVYEGPAMEVQVQRFQGHFTAPRYEFLQNDAHGEAARAEFIDQDHTVVYGASYTTCRRKPGPDWLPDWILRAERLELDNERDEGVAHGAVLSFKGVPLLPVPALAFPLSDKRRSGFLPPTVTADNVNGTEVVLPYYWNIAPNRDATITPTLMTARGVDVGAEFRYLERGYQGSARLNAMPSDKLRAMDRWGVALQHSASVRTEALPAPVNVSFMLNRVSDNDYWSDFTRSAGSLTQRLLSTQLSASAAHGPWSWSATAQSWQTLQSSSAPIVPPYDRLPQLQLRYGLDNDAGWDWSAQTELTRFSSDPALTGQPNAQRLIAQGQLARPLVFDAGSLTPKLQWHGASYDFSSPLPSGASTQGVAVPSFSLDGTVVFERQARYLGQDFVQTLEPRALYVRTPNVNQSMLPNYDTAAQDFNFASIYGDNSFVGQDKVADNHLLTLGLGSRLIDPDSGAQVLKLALAQRIRFEDQRVGLNSSAAVAKAGLSDVLLGAVANVSQRWALDATAQYNANTGLSERSTVAARYQPGPYRVLNAAYRFTRNQSEQIDLSWQWPLNAGAMDSLLGGRGLGEGRYYAVGRMNYSMNESRLVDTVLGLEYDAGCWLSRVVLERISTSTSSATQRLMFQLEFVGLTKLGFSPQRTLTSHIARYQELRETSTNNSRFSNYD